MSRDDHAAREAAVDAITELFVATDRRDWSAVESCFSDTVHFDMTSLAGGEPSVLSPGEISSAWAQGLAPIQSVHHQIGNVQVKIDGTRATASCYGIAYHFRRVASGRNIRTFVGSYDFHLERTETNRWRINLFRFNLKFLDGNVELHAEEPAA